MTAIVPHYRPGWRGLGEALLYQGKIQEALALAGQLEGNPRLAGEGAMLAGRAAAVLRDVATARRELERASAVMPADPEPLRELCRVLFEQVDPAEAEGVVRELLRREPRDASAHHNLGTVHLRRGNPAAAVEAYQRSLQFRRDHAATHFQLGCAFDALGRRAEAIAAWERTLALAPDHTETAKALQSVRRERR